MIPDLAVEVLSNSNTPAEMDRKRDDYFASGVKLVWIFDSKAATVAVYTRVNNPTVLTVSETLDGGGVLPGFSVVIKSLFDEVDKQLGVET